MLYLWTTRIDFQIVCHGIISMTKLSNFYIFQAKQVCKCKHTMSWWVTLALERARRQTKYKQVYTMYWLYIM